MEWVETTGRTVAEALEAALDQLGVDEHDAEVVIVEEPKTALFGLRKSEARVRARVRPTSPRPKRQQRDRRGRSREGGGRSSSERAGGRAGAGGGAEGGADEREPAAVGARSGEGDAEGGTAGAGGSRNRRRRRRGGRSGAGGAGAEEGAEAAAGEGVGEEAGGAPARGGRADGSPTAGGGRGGAGRSRQRSSERRSASETSGEPEEEEMPIEQQAELAERFVRGVVECFGLDGATTSVEVDEALVEVAVTGEGLGLLIGPHGSTLSALQELTRTVVQRRGTEHGTRIVVDVAGYRAKRAAALVQFTKSVAAEVLASGRAHSLEPMSASDRKIVHDTVNEIEGVSTSSEGEEERRHVVIHAATGAPTAPATAAPATAAPASAAEPGEPADDDVEAVELPIEVVGSADEDEGAVAFVEDGDEVADADEETDLG